MPAKRAWLIVTDGAAAGNVRTMSVTGVTICTPRSVTAQSVWPEIALAVTVPFETTLHHCWPAAFRHMRASPCGERVMSRTEIVPGPFVENVIRRVSPRGSFAASSLRLTNVSVAVGSPGTDGLAGAGVPLAAAWLGATAALGLAGGALAAACEGGDLLGTDDGAT